MRTIDLSPLHRFAVGFDRMQRQFQNWTEETIETFKLNCKEFLQEETRDLPAGPEADIFYQQVDQLRSDFDRLSARIELITNR